MLGHNVGSITLSTQTNHTLGVAGRPTRIYDVYVKGIASATAGTFQLMNNAAAGTEFVNVQVDARINSDITNWIHFPAYGLLFPNTCYAVKGTAIAYATITYEVLP
jgi:hypothetical protein